MPGNKITMLPDSVVAACTLDAGQASPAVSLGRGRRGVGAGRPARPGHAPGRPPGEDGRQGHAGARGRDPGPLRPRARRRRPRGNELGSPVGQEAGTRARRLGVPRDHHLPKTRKVAFSPDVPLCYPLRTARGQKMRSLALRSQNVTDDLGAARSRGPHYDTTRLRRQP